MRTALIGFGNMGKNHYRLLKALPAVELIAVCDPRINASLEEKTFTDIDSMLRQNDIEAAVICVPTSLHKEIALKCIEHKINILIEKPLASNVTDGLEIKHSVEQYGIRAAVGHVERFNPVISSLKRELKGKRIYSINIARVGPFPPRVKDVGILVDLSVHDIDLIRFITDKEKIVESRIFKSDHSKCSNQYEDNAIISVRLQNGIIASITTNWLTPFKKRVIEVATDTAYYEANLMTQELKEYSEYQADNSFVVRYCKVRKGEPLLRELESFVDYVKTGRMRNLADIEDGLKTLEIIYKRRNGAKA